MQQLIYELVTPKVLDNGELENVSPIRLRAAKVIEEILQQWEQDKQGRLKAEAELNKNEKET